MPIASPVRVAIWVGTWALSVKVSLPASSVPVGLVSVVGLNVTETWQLEFAATEPPQVLEVIS